MTSHDLEGIVLAPVSEGKGRLAAEETAVRLTRRFDVHLRDAGRRALRRSASLNPAAILANYTDEMEQTCPGDPPHLRD